ncbi:MAG: CinA family nicotinamide mononucleotide deamidase-related protein [Limnochordia bacterium]
MIAETIFVGTELLLGQIVNTNAAYLGEQLSLLGIDSYYQSVVGDNPRRLAACLKQAVERSDVVIASGGLGPTMDDVTRETAAEITQRSLRFDAGIWERIKGRRRGAIPENMKRQAMVPDGAEVLPNDVGSAPGLAIPTCGDEKLIILLPGPPHELQPMFERYVIPLLLARLGERTTLVSRTLRFCDIGESPLEDRLKDLIANQKDPTLATYAKPGDVQLRISTKASSHEEGMRRILAVENEIRHRVGGYIYGADDTTLEKAVGDLLRRCGWRVAVVDTQSGGTLITRITEPAGSDAWFAGGLVASSPAQAAMHLRQMGATPSLPDKGEQWSPQAWSDALLVATEVFDANVAVTLLPGEDDTAHIAATATTGRRCSTSAGAGRGNRETWRWRLSQSALVQIRRLVTEHILEKDG